MSAKSDYLEWRRSPKVACVFARWLTAHQDQGGQYIAEVSQSSVPQRVATAIANRIDALVADPSIAAASLILPNIKTIRALTEVALSLRGHPKWSVTTTKLPPPPTADLVRVHIVRDLPFESETRPSELLAFGPFNVFPPTRKAPVVALEVFVGNPMANDPGTGDPTDKTNLAHMDLRGTDISPKLYNHMWEQSHAARLVQLGNHEDLRAKAKVSFVISAALARRLGCAPP